MTMYANAQPIFLSCFLVTHWTSEESVHVHVCLLVSLHVCACMSVYMGMCECIHMHVYAYVRVQTCLHVCTCQPWMLFLVTLRLVF